MENKAMIAETYKYFKVNVSSNYGTILILESLQCVLHVVEQMPGCEHMKELQDARVTPPVLLKLLHVYL